MSKKQMVTLVSGIDQNVKVTFETEVNPKNGNLMITKDKYLEIRNILMCGQKWDSKTDLPFGECSSLSSTGATSIDFSTQNKIKMVEIVLFE